MNYRQVYIWNGKSETATSGTLTEEITLDQPISRLHLNVLCTTTTGAELAHPAKMITKFEIVDGSDVLFSLSGREIQALQYYTGRKDMFNGNIVKGAEAFWVSLEIDFGRYLYDPELALMPAKFKTPTIRITYNTALSGTVSATDWDLIAYVFDDKAISPQGFLMAKEHQTYVPTASTHKYIDLPTDYPIRMLMLQGLSNTRDAVQMLDFIKLSEDHDKRIPYNIRGRELHHTLVDLYGFGKERIKLAAGTAKDHIYTMLAHNPMVHPIGQTKAGTFLLDHTGAGDLNITSSVASNTCEGYVIGSLPHGALILPLGDRDDIMDFYDVARIGSLRLDLLATSNVGTSPAVQVVVQQLRTY